MAEIIVDSEVLFYAFRYALGRKTYVVNDVVRALREHWTTMKVNEQRLIHKEILEAIKENNAGMDCDITEWKRILELGVQK